MSAERSGRLEQAGCDSAVLLLAHLPFVTDTDLGDAVRSRVTTRGREHGLTFYDAAYLELSLRLSCRLKTFDRHLLALRPKFSHIV